MDHKVTRTRTSWEATTNTNLCNSNAAAAAAAAESMQQSESSPAACSGIRVHADAPVADGEAAAGPILTGATQTRVPTSNVTCFKCGNLGHEAVECPCTCRFRCRWLGSPCLGASR